MTGFIRTYQTLIVGVLGFLGVMATLALNAWLARNAEQRKIAHEARILRTALVEEMKVQRDALTHTVEASKQSTEMGQSDVLTPLRRYSDIFDKSADKLGLLESDEVEAVLNAYLPLKELTPKIRLLEARIHHHRVVEYSEAPPRDYALIQRDDVEFLAGLHSVYIPPIDTAIEKLRSNLQR